MLRHTDEQTDLDLVVEYLVGRGLSAERFSHAEMLTGRTPDFRVRRDGAVVAFCEVKSPNDPWLDGLLDDAPAMTVVGGARPDPIFNRLARLIAKAETQFASVNPAHAELNILAIVNHDGASHFGDLVETLTGYFHAADGKKYPTMQHIAEGRIGEAQRRIDAFLWFDGKTGFMASPPLINDLDPERVRQLCALLSIDPN